MMYDVEKPTLPFFSRGPTTLHAFTMEEPRVRTSMSARAVAGVAGAVLTNALLTPLDVLKVRQQNFVGSGSAFSTANSKLPCTGCGHFSRNTGGLIDRFLCTASRSSTASSVSRFSTTPPSLCGLCGNHQHQTHSLWERCTPPKKNFTTRAHSHIHSHTHHTATSNSILLRTLWRWSYKSLQMSSKTHYTKRMCLHHSVVLKRMKERLSTVVSES